MENTAIYQHKPRLELPAVALLPKINVAAIYNDNEKTIKAVTKSAVRRYKATSMANIILPFFFDSSDSISAN